jgi:hypothetical protein
MYAKPMFVVIFVSVMKVLIVTYHAPQTKNSRNIMMDRRVIGPAEDRGGGEA